MCAGSPHSSAYLYEDEDSLKHKEAKHSEKLWKQELDTRQCDPRDPAAGSVAPSTHSASLGLNHAHTQRNISICFLTHILSL